MGLFGFGKRKARAENPNQASLVFVQTGLQICNDYVKVCDRSNAKEREFAIECEESYIPVLKEALTKGDGLVPDGVVYILNIICACVLATLDGTTSQERELIQDTRTLAFLIKDIPMRVPESTHRHFSSVLSKYK